MYQLLIKIKLYRMLYDDNIITVEYFCKLMNELFIQQISFLVPYYEIDDIRSKYSITNMPHSSITTHQESKIIITST